MTKVTKMLGVACASCSWVWAGSVPAEGIRAVRTHRRECGPWRRSGRFVYFTREEDREGGVGETS